MDEKMWDQVMAVHLRGTFKVSYIVWKIFIAKLTRQCVKACWPHFQKQKYGRIITTCSPNGICKCNQQGSKALLRFRRYCWSGQLLDCQGCNLWFDPNPRHRGSQGKHQNQLYRSASRYRHDNDRLAQRHDRSDEGGFRQAPLLYSHTDDQPEFISPIVGYLASEQCEDSGTLQEVFGGYAAGIRWQRSFGAALPNDVNPTPEQIVAKWKEITTFGQFSNGIM